jgi:uncharacterized protein (TIGR02265 family)
MTIDATGFVHPDWSAPLDVEAYAALCSEPHRLRGVFLQSLVEQARRAGRELPSARRYLAFKDYPASEYLRLAAECARLVHPRSTLRQALRELGRDAFPSFRSTMVAKVVLAATGDHLARVIEAADKVYEVSISPGTARSRVVGDRALVELRDIPTFADSFHVGAFEGVLSEYRKTGTVLVRPHSLGDVDLLLDWS